MLSHISEYNMEMSRCKPTGIFEELENLLDNIKPWIGKNEYRITIYKKESTQHSTFPTSKLFCLQK